MTDPQRKLDFEYKLRLLRSLMTDQGIASLQITSVVNFAWLTGGGRAFVNIANENACGKILVTLTDAFVLTTNNEVNRLQTEELADFGLRAIIYPWYESLTNDLLLQAGLTLPIVTDRELEPELSLLRSQLTDREAQLIKKLGQESAAVVETACRELSVGDKECEIAGRISNGFWAAGMEPLVLNIAADERAFTVRHPIPTTKALREHLAISVCVKKWGLNVTFTRIVHFGSLSDELRNKHLAAVEIEARAIAQTCPDTLVQAIFEDMLKTYHRTGFPDEWRQHPIGGLIGYQPREFDVNPQSRQILRANQAFVWNPTIAGTKSEDTLLIGTDQTDIITRTGRFPELDVQVDGQSIKRPNILIR